LAASKKSLEVITSGVFLLSCPRKSLLDLMGIKVASKGHAGFTQ
jgi:hypothetical protein